jgi:G3E family GTPase
VTLSAQTGASTSRINYLKLRQVGFADMLVLNKVDLAGSEQVEKARAWLDEHFNRLRIVETDYCEVPYEILLGVGRFDAARAALGSPAGEHECDDPNCRGEHHVYIGDDPSKLFSTWSYETDRPLSLEALREAVRKLPGTVYRVKGVVYASDVPERRAVLQVVGRRLDISVHEEWGERTPRTQIVAIGLAGSSDAGLLDEAFASAVSAATKT